MFLIQLPVVFLLSEWPKLIVTKPIEIYLFKFNCIYCNFPNNNAFPQFALTNANKIMS